MKNWMRKMEPYTKSPVLTPILLALTAACVGVLSLWFACVENHQAMFLSYFTHPMIAFLNLLAPVVLALLLYFFTRRAVLSYGITAVLVAGFTIASYFKLIFRNDPMMFEDLFLMKEAGNMVGKYQLFLTGSMALALVLLLLGGVFLHFFARARMERLPRLAGSAALLLLLIPLAFLYWDSNVYNNLTRNEGLISPWSATQVYTSKGFVYPFLHSIKAASDAPPDGYDARRAQSLLESYQDADIPADRQVDLIAIQLEAYNDFTRFGVPELDSAVYEEYHKLEAEGYSGNLVTNIFAGGTVDTERCFLTGFSRLGSFRAPTNSYAWYLRSQGYRVEGSHSCYAWFYNRENINANLGFEDYYFLENYYGALTGNQVGADAVLIPEIRALYQNHKAASLAPYFSFNVTYQGHGPYSDEKTYWGDGWVKGGDYTPQERTILDNYFGSIKNTNDNLKLFFDYFRASPDPVVIVLFGDHNPWMGDGNSLYHLLGIDLDLSTKEGFLNYYATRYLIWANDAAKEALGNDFRGEGPDLGPYFLMNEVFRLCGWEGPAYLQATNAILTELPVFNTPTGLYLEDGVLTDTLTAAHQALAQDYFSLQYYYRKHFLY